MARVDDDRHDLADWLKHAESLIAQVDPKGRAHGGLFMALSIARTSLNAGTPRAIASALRAVSVLVAHVNGLAASEKELLPRHAGGKKRAIEHAEDTADRWAQYEAMFVALADGKGRLERLKARRLVESRMAKDGFRNPGTKKSPTRQTIARHFPTK
jgi:hypothetical protein